MRRETIIGRSIVVGVLCLLVPLALALIVAVHRGKQGAIAALNVRVDEMARRAMETRGQIDSSLDALSADGSAPCSGAQMAKMRSMSAEAYYVAGLGYEANDTLLCSTLTSVGHPVFLGAASQAHRAGTKGWDQKTLPSIPGRKFNLVGRNGYVVIISPELVVDVAAPSDVWGLLEVGREGNVIRFRGTYSLGWLKQAPDASGSFLDGGSLVVVRADQATGHTMFASMPVAEIHGYMMKALKQGVPLALAISALLLGCVWFYTRELLSMKSQIKLALKNRDFFLLYQPVMDLKNGRCVGAEALIRWKSRDGTMVSPLVFIPVAEKYGLIEQVTTQVMEMVAEDAAPLIRNNPETHIAINFSPDDLHSTAIEERLQSLIRNVGSSSNIVIEATERGLLFPEKVTGTLISVRAKGFRVGIDDFGTGSSSLSYLGTYDLDFLKIDKMFVDGLGKEGSTSQVAFHIIELAHTLGLQIVAEGVETQQQREILQDAGVQYAQGWVFAKPMGMGDLTEFMRAQNV